MGERLDLQKDEDGQRDLSRRQLGVGLLAALGGGLGGVSTAEGFSRSAKGEFNAASRILDRYGVAVSGDTSLGHDAVNFAVVPVAGTEYTHLVSMPNELGQIIPCIKTSTFGDDATFTHFHPAGDGEIVPCVRTTIEGHRLATYEVLDASEVDLIPCIKVQSQMLEGGVLGAVEVITDTDVDLTVRVGDKTYRLIDGELVLVLR